MSSLSVPVNSSRNFSFPRYLRSTFIYHVVINDETNRRYNDWLQFYSLNPNPNSKRLMIIKQRNLPRKGTRREEKKFEAIK